MEHARADVNADDFAVIADDMMFYRSTAHEYDRRVFRGVLITPAWRAKIRATLSLP
jgi:hypothetical protein